MIGLAYIGTAHATTISECQGLMREESENRVTSKFDRSAKALNHPAASEAAEQKGGVTTGKLANY